MTMQRPRYPLLASLPLVALCAGAATLVAQTPKPPAADVVLREVAVAPKDRIQLSADQVRALVASRYPGVADGTSDENYLTVVISSSGQLVATGMTQATIFAKARLVATKDTAVLADRALVEQKLAMAARNEKAGDVVRTVTVDSAARTDRENTLIAKLMVGTENHDGMLNLAGVGQIDARLVRDQYLLSYEPGARMSEISTGLRVAPARPIELRDDNWCPVLLGCGECVLENWPALRDSRPYLLRADHGDGVGCERRIGNGELRTAGRERFARRAISLAR